MNPPILMKVIFISPQCRLLSQFRTLHLLHQKHPIQVISQRDTPHLILITYRRELGSLIRHHDTASRRFRIRIRLSTTNAE